MLAPSAGCGRVTGRQPASGPEPGDNCAAAAAVLLPLQVGNTGPVQEFNIQVDPGVRLQACACHMQVEHASHNHVGY